MDLDVTRILRTVLDQYQLPWDGTHGVSHWARVLENGRRLAVHTGATLMVVELFALLHDAKRVNEGIDEEHGRRAAEWAAQLRGSLFQLPDAEFERLSQACARHTDGLVEGDVTVQTCWDADRLDLGRVRIPPHVSKLCTSAAKEPQMMTWADGRACFRVVPEIVRVEWGIAM